jgi:hypothetical protein
LNGLKVNEALIFLDVKLISLQICLNGFNSKQSHF